MMHRFLVTLVLLVPPGAGMAGAAPVERADLQAHGDAMLKNAEDMVAHGGMGDAQAIVHHCGEVTREAEALLKLLAPSDRRSQAAVTPLKDTIRYCDRVAQLGSKVDPGVTLNPATKARAAAREAVKHLFAIDSPAQ